jgi:hypothetical protein
MRRPWIAIPISSKCQVSAGQGRSWRRFLAKTGPNVIPPAPDRFGRDLEAALGQEFLDIAVAQREPEIQPDCVPNDLRRERVTRIGDRVHSPTLS